MKNEILNVLNMEDILNKYNIKLKNKQFCCPFHQDKTPSAKIYTKTFYCFGCGKTGDLIQFVQYLFNLSFKEAMQKINEDFNLGLNYNIKLDRKKIEQIQLEKVKKNEKIKKIENNIERLCVLRLVYKNKIKKLEEKITIKNWDEDVLIISELRECVIKIDYEIDELLDSLYKVKNS